MGHASPFQTFTFQKIFNNIKNSQIQWVLTPCNCLLKIKTFIKTPILKMGAHLGMWGFIPSHFATFPGAWNVTLGFHSWLAPLQALALVASPSLRLWHIVVITFSSSFFPFFSNYYCYYVFFFSFVFLIDFFLLLWLFFIFSFFLFIYYYNLFINFIFFPFPSSSI